MSHVEERSTGTLVMVRTTCCETYKCTGTRCSICPNRPENQDSVRRYLQELSSRPLGRSRAIYTPHMSAEA
jgi:hypothetical protein